MVRVLSVPDINQHPQKVKKSKRVGSFVVIYISDTEYRRKEEKENAQILLRSSRIINHACMVRSLSRYIYTVQQIFVLVVSWYRWANLGFLFFLLLGIYNIIYIVEYYPILTKNN